MNVLAIIPARYASTRFPGKPLALLGGRPIVEWVWRQVSAAVSADDIVVATDDQRIIDAVTGFGGHAMMTSSTHKSGTDRCGEVLERLEQQGRRYDIVVNVQGDEPFIQPEQIRTLIDSFSMTQTEIATLRKVIGDIDELTSPHNVKVVANPEGRAIYFSRHPIPYLRSVKMEQWIDTQRYYKHIGIYAFRSEVLKAVVKLSQSPLEKSESLEQLRWIENGYGIQVCDTDFENIGIDTPEDLTLAEMKIKHRI